MSEALEDIEMGDKNSIMMTNDDDDKTRRANAPTTITRYKLSTQCCE
ncbi:unnamed protein product [Bathycoccus prasinos]